VMNMFSIGTAVMDMYSIGTGALKLYHLFEWKRCYNCLSFLTICMQNWGSSVHDTDSITRSVFFFYVGHRGIEFMHRMFD
jgi:hypothetical protein